jgi:hypothetical protein
MPVGQLADLQQVIEGLMVLVQTAAGGPNKLRIYDFPPTQPPEMPCIFQLTPEEDPYENMDTIFGRSVVTVTLRLCTEMSTATEDLLLLADAVIETADVWLRTEHPSPLDQARRLSSRPVTPVFNEIPVRGMDFAIRCELEFRQTTPAPVP